MPLCMHPANLPHSLPLPPQPLCKLQMPACERPAATDASGQQVCSASNAARMPPVAPQPQQPSDPRTLSAVDLTAQLVAEFSAANGRGSLFAFCRDSASPCDAGEWVRVSAAAQRQLQLMVERARCTFSGAGCMAGHSACLNASCLRTSLPARHPQASSAAGHLRGPQKETSCS